MSALFTTISRELREDAANISEIICNDKYELLWSSDITDDMLTHIAYYMTVDDAQELLEKFVIKFDVLINNLFMIQSIYTGDKVPTGYNIAEQRMLIDKILKLCHKGYYMKYISPNMVNYILDNCGYTMMQWLQYQKMMFVIERNGMLISSYVDQIIPHDILYDNSLRNTWIMTCLSYN